MQDFGATLNQIAQALIPFYAGTIVFGLIGGIVSHKLDIRLALVIALIIQTLFGFLCLIVQDIGWIAILRFMQGAATGWSRPLAHIWANELLSGAKQDSREKALINTIVQTAIGLGMVLGNAVGVWLGEKPTQIVFHIILMIIPVLVTSHLMLRTNVTENSRAKKSSHVAIKLSEVFRHESVVMTFLIFMISMAYYNVWPLILPFEARQRWGGMPIEFTTALVVQPLLFSIGQLVFAIYQRHLEWSPRKIILILILLHLLSLVFAFFCLMTDTTIEFTLIFLLATTITVAGIYPLSMLILMNYINYLPKKNQQVTQRKLLFAFGFAGDIGQLIGGMTLTLSHFQSVSEDIFIFLGIFTVLCLGVQYVRLRMV